MDIFKNALYSVRVPRAAEMTYGARSPHSIRTRLYAPHPGPTPATLSHAQPLQHCHFRLPNPYTARVVSSFFFTNRPSTRVFLRFPFPIYFRPVLLSSPVHVQTALTYSLYRLISGDGTPNRSVPTHKHMHGLYYFITVAGTV